MAKTDHGDDAPKAGHPGPTDKGGNGGMATREQAADSVPNSTDEKDERQT
ncbi:MULTISPECIES: hypothetical protein [Rhodococcus]|nr:MULTISPECIES: hypothetical protein [Rhodococcus]KJF22883.1 hypothetical protein SZ00_03537 [Rhodococcus sp. AD45]QXW03262.1 hypothetical protein KYT97_04040 [Rhodococcus globerulus]